MIKLDFSELPISPRQYKSAGFFLIGAGALLLLLGLILAIITVNRRTTSAERTKISAEECIKKIQPLNLETSAQDDGIHILSKDLNRGTELLAASSQAAVLCPNWIMDNYCLGDACTPPGMTMHLKYQEKK